MVRHFLAWIPHKRPLNAPVSRDTSSIAERAFAPREHLTRQPGLKHKVIRKDVVWLVGSHKALGRPEAAIDGRIVVEDKDEIRDPENRPTLVFKAGVGSQWFPWRDATKLVKAALVRKCRTTSDHWVSDSGLRASFAQKASPRLNSLQPIFKQVDRCS